jgi:lipopolysaccharide export system permease protein
MTYPKIPFLLYSYIATELLAPFFACFLILYGVFFLVRLIPLLEIVLNLGIGPADFIRLFAYIFPHMLLYIIPMASMAGVIIAFSRLSSDGEILAMKSCGISLRMLLPPVLIVSLAIALLTGFFSVKLIPAGDIAMRQLLFQLAKEKIDRGLKEKQFTDTLGELVVYVDKIDDNNNSKWYGVFVSDMRNREQPIITMAKSGYMVAELDRMKVTITLNDGTLHSTDGFDNQIISFKRYLLQIPLKPPTKIGKDDITLLDKGSMSQAELLEASISPDFSPGARAMFHAEYHHRIALPAGCFILSIIGLTLGLRAGQGRRGMGIPLGLFFFISYYLLMTTSRIMVEELKIPVAAGMWLPNVFFLITAVYLFLRAEAERPMLPQAIHDKLTRVFQIISNHVSTALKPKS